MTTFSISLQPQPGYSGHEFCAPIPCISHLLHDLGLDVPGQDDNIGWPVAVQPFLGHNRNPATGQEFSLFGRVLVHDIGQQIRANTGNEKDHLMATVVKLCKIYFVDLLGFCLMGNHFHLAVRMNPSDDLTDENITERYKLLYGQEAKIIPCQIDDFRNRLTSLGGFVKDIKQGVTKYFNKRKKRWGTFWGERFTLLNSLSAPAQQGLTG